MKRVLLLTFLLLSMIACDQGASDLGSSRNQEANPLAPSFWPAGAASFPLNVSLSTSFATNEIDAIESSALSWTTALSNRATFFDTTGRVSEKGGSLNSYNDGLMAVYKLNTWPSDLPGTALAVTQIFGLRRNVGQSNEVIEITHADILVNYDNFSFSTNGGSGYDLETVILHEFGHFLGLGHDNSSTSVSVMFPSISRYISNRTPLDNDINALSGLYNLGVSASNAPVRGIASIQSDSFEQEDNGITETVVIQYELRADGSEKVKVNNKYLKNYKCNHKH